MLKTTKSHEVIRALKAIFARHGIPEEVRRDNGPQYASVEFTHFAKEWGFKHTTSTHRFPQSNAEAERSRNLQVTAEEIKWSCWILIAYWNTRNTPDLTCHAFNNQPHQRSYIHISCKLYWKYTRSLPFSEHYIRGKHKTNLETTRRNRDKLRNCTTSVNLTSLG